MDNPTRRLDELPARPTVDRACLRCQTPMLTAQIRTKIATGWRPAYYALRLRRLIDRSVLWGDQFTETGCAVWVCPACGYTELAANKPAALLERI